MKAISLWEPWASLMAAGAKRVETRSWSTKYRGPLLICAAKRKMDDAGHAILRLAEQSGFHVEPHYGMAVCLVNLIRCDVIVQFEPTSLEHALGVYTPDRFAWVTNELYTFLPFPMTGHQGLFRVDDTLELRMQMSMKKVQ